MYNGKSGKKKDYSQLSLDDFSDDDSDDGNGAGFRDEPNEADEYIRNQQVRGIYSQKTTTTNGYYVRSCQPICFRCFKLCFVGILHPISTNSIFQ